MAKKRIVYPSIDNIVAINEIVNLMSNRKADKHKLTGDKFIESIINETERSRGDIYEKAAILLRGLVVSHGFESGNKRTAFIVSMDFIITNGGKEGFKSFDEVEKVLRGIRSYGVKEIAKWLRTGDIL